MRSVYQAFPPPLKGLGTRLLVGTVFSSEQHLIKILTEVFPGTIGPSNQPSNVSCDVPFVDQSYRTIDRKNRFKHFLNTL